MADNRVAYGFRPYKPKGGGSDVYNAEEYVVATAASFDVSAGAQNVGLGVGDPVVLASTGTVTMALGVENGSPSASLLGVVVGVLPYWDATEGAMKHSSVLPSDVAWGTNESRKSKVLVLPIDSCLWEVDVDDATTATTETAYRAFVGENVQFVLTGLTSDTRAKPELDISTHSTATSANAVFRIRGISDSRDNNDFSGANVKLVVSINASDVQNASDAGV